MIKKIDSQTDQPRKPKSEKLLIGLSSISFGLNFLLANIVSDIRIQKLQLTEASAYIFPIMSLALIKIGESILPRRVKRVFYIGLVVANLGVPVLHGAINGAQTGAFCKAETSGSATTDCLAETAARYDTMLDESTSFISLPYNAVNALSFRIAAKYIP